MTFGETTERSCAASLRHVCIMQYNHTNSITCSKHTKEVLQSKRKQQIEMVWKSKNKSKIEERKNLVFGFLKISTKRFENDSQTNTFEPIESFCNSVASMLYEKFRVFPYFIRRRVEIFV